MLGCSYISLHAVTLACMQFHEHACSSLLCLSSEQLTRMSQCLFSFNWKNPKKCCKFLNSFVYLPDSNLHLEPQQKDFYSKFWYFLNLKSFVFFCKQSFAFVCLVFIISAYNSFKRRIKSICSCIIPLWAEWSPCLSWCWCTVCGGWPDHGLTWPGVCRGHARSEEPLINLWSSFKF